MSCALLIAEPEPETGGFLERHLAEDGFEVLRTEDGEAALSLAEQVRPDLVLLGGELDVCRRLREGEPGRSWNRDVPVIVLGPEEADAIDRVRAFDRGADDFVSRPVVYDELLARIRAVLRRVSPPQAMLIEVGELRIDRSTRCLTVNGELLSLPARQFDLLAKLASRPTHVFPKDELLKDVWGFRSAGRTRTLDSHASRLRRRLAEATDTPLVLNIWGVGRGVAGRVGMWREVASLHGFGGLLRAVERSGSAAFGYGLGTQSTTEGRATSTKPRSCCSAGRPG